MTTNKLEFVKSTNFLAAMASEIVYSYSPNNANTMSLSFQYNSVDARSMTLTQIEGSDQSTVSFQPDDSVAIREVICRIDMPIPQLKESCIKILEHIEKIQNSSIQEPVNVN